MKKLFLLITTLLTLNSYAGIEQAPPAFKVNGAKLVFVDFLRATYDLTYDYQAKTAVSKATFIFKANEAGYPIFDSVIRPNNIALNGVSVEQGYTAVPGNVSSVRYAKSAVSPGVHTLTVETQISNGTKYSWRGVSSGFFIKDLKDRMMLERYVPTNLEYDQYPMTWNVKVLGSKRAHNVFANGKVKELGHNHIQIQFPSYFTASSLYFHLVPKRKFWRHYFTYTSINGNQFPVTIYSRFRFRNWIFKRKTLKVLKELERDYGPYPHPHLVIYGTKLRGGMEYVGATATSLVALGHELQHMWFAKGLMPADGNSGWMDEGIASWRDKGHQIHTRPNYFSANLGKHNVYTRKTDKRSYEKGRSFIAYLDYQLRQAGFPGMKDFLRGYFNKRKFTTVTTYDFKSDLEDYANIDFTDDFNQYIFGGYPDSKGRAPAVEPENPFHPSYSEADIQSIL